MRKTTLLALAALAAASTSALAQSTSASWGCTADYRVAGSVALSIPAADVGRPGFVVLVAERGEDMAFLDPSGQWVISRMPFAHEYQRFNALPPSVTFGFCSPEPRIDDYGHQEFVCAMTSAFSAGTILHASWGALTPEIEARANDRELSMAAANQRLISLGREPRTFDRQRFIEAAVLRDARKINPVVVGSVPFINCTPPDTSGGS